MNFPQDRGREQESNVRRKKGNVFNYRDISRKALNHFSEWFYCWCSALLIHFKATLMTNVKIQEKSMIVINSTYTAKVSAKAISHTQKIQNKIEEVGRMEVS